MPYSCSWTDDKNTIWLVLLVIDNLIYLATNIPKQSCSSSLTRSCAGTLLAALSCSHSSKFQTSQTWSVSRSASTTRRPQLITRFLISTAVRSPWLTASIQQTASSDLARDASNPASTGKVVTPATRFTVTSSYRVLIRMPNLPEKTFGRNAALAGTYGKRNKTRDHTLGARGPGNQRKHLEYIVGSGWRYPPLTCQ